MLFKALSNSGGEGVFGNSSIQTISYYELKQKIEAKEITQVSIGQTMIRALAEQNGQRVTYNVRKVNDSSLVPLLDANKIPYSGFSESNWFTDLLGWLLPVLIILGLWMFIAGRMQRNMGNGIFGMGSSKRLVNAEKPKVRFDDMAGNKEAKEEVVEIVDFLKYPDGYFCSGREDSKRCVASGSTRHGKNATC